MIPIEKNIIVTDANGNTIGSTYPKRAKGLVKQGRAEYADDQTIRLKITHVPTADITTEEKKMSKVIDFNARKFRFDETCVSTDGAPVNAGQRAFVTTSAGNTEVWEIGDWRWTWSQIRQDMTLEPNTDYVFRVSVEGGVCDTNDMTTVAHLTPKDNWDERYTFLLDHDKFRPVICKNVDGGLIRVFELPFSTGEYTEWTVLFAAQHAVTRFFAPVSAESLGNYSDTNYRYWWEHRNDGKNSDISDIIKNAAGEFDPERFEATLTRAFENLHEPEDDDDGGDNMNLGISDREFDENGFAQLIAKIGDNCNIAFENITVNQNSIGVVEKFDVGCKTDCTNIAVSNCTLTSIAFSMLIDKLGDNSNLVFESVTVSSEGVDRMLRGDNMTDCSNVILKNVTVPQKVLDLIPTVFHENCHLFTEGVEIG